MVQIKCYKIVDGKEVFAFNRDENKFTSQRIKDENYTFKGKRGSIWEYSKYDEKNKKAIIDEVVS